MSESTGEKVPSQTDSPKPTDGSWPPVPPPVVNRLVSSATAVPFTPAPPSEAPKSSSSTAPMFSCIVEPPPKKPRVSGPDAKPAESPVKARTVTPTAPTARVPAVTPTASANGGTKPPLPAGTGATAALATTGTVPPFGMGSGTQTPFGASETAAPFSADGKFEFNPEKKPGARWLSWSTLVFLLVCAGGYWKYRQMQAEPLPPPKPPPVAVTSEPVKSGASGGMVTPFTALKQAKATIKEAGDKHKATYDMLEKMLDDPNAAVDAAPKPATPVVAVEAPVETAPKAPRDYASVQLGSDGEFVVPAGSPRPSVGFVKWIKASKIGGVRLTDRPRVLIGANAYTFGDVVEFNLGIVLEGYNAETRTLRFKEASGAVIERRI